MLFKVLVAIRMEKKFTYLRNARNFRNPYKKDSGKSAKVNVLKEKIAPLTLLRLLENRFENNASERTWTMQLGPIISNDARTDATKYNISDNGHVSRIHTVAQPRELHVGHGATCRS